MRRATALAALILSILLTTSVFAGVVEDAEEALKNVPSDGPGRALQGVEGQARPLPGSSSSVSSGRSGSSTVNGRASSSSGRRSSSGGPGSGSGGAVTVAAESTPQAESQETLRRKTQESKDLAMSFAGVLVLLFFVVLAGYYSRRLGGNPD